MSERFSAEINIGGKLKRELIEDLLGCLENDSCGKEWDSYDPESIFKEKDLLATSEAKEWLNGKSSEAKWGEFEETEQFCHENNLSFIRHSSAYSDEDANLTVFLPDYNIDRIYYANAVGAIMLNKNEYDSIMAECGTDLDLFWKKLYNHFHLIDNKLPQFEIID